MGVIRLVGFENTYYNHGEYISWYKDNVVWLFKHDQIFEGFDIEYKNLTVKTCSKIRVTVKNFVTNIETSGVITYFGNNYMIINGNKYDFSGTESCENTRISPFNHVIFSVLGYGEIKLEPLDQVENQLKINYAIYNERLCVSWVKDNKTHIKYIEGSRNQYMERLYKVDYIHEEDIRFKCYTDKYKTKLIKLTPNHNELYSLMDHIKEHNKTINYIYDVV